MELLAVEQIDFETNFIEVLFDGLFKEGFYVTTEFDYDVELIDVADEDTNCKEWKEPTNISFWDFKTWDNEEEEISINNRELNRIKQLVEFKLIDLLTEEINNL
jgi:hypothetical protein